MPRNGDESSNNGPIDAGEIVHGASGDKTLKHTQNVAPMPEAEKGAAIEGMNASGGGVAGEHQPSNGASDKPATK